MLPTFLLCMLSFSAVWEFSGNININGCLKCSLEAFEQSFMKADYFNSIPHVFINTEAIKIKNKKRFFSCMIKGTLDLSNAAAFLNV